MKSRIGNGLEIDNIICIRFSVLSLPNISSPPLVCVFFIQSCVWYRFAAMFALFVSRFQFSAFSSRLGFFFPVFFSQRFPVLSASTFHLLVIFFISDFLHSFSFFTSFLWCFFISFLSFPSSFLFLFVFFLLSLLFSLSLKTFIFLPFVYTFKHSSLYFFSFSSSWDFSIILSFCFLVFLSFFLYFLLFFLYLFLRYSLSFTSFNIFLSFFLPFRFSRPFLLSPFLSFFFSFSVYFLFHFFLLHFA